MGVFHPTRPAGCTYVLFGSLSSLPSLSRGVQDSPRSLARAIRPNRASLRGQAPLVQAMTARVLAPVVLPPTLGLPPSPFPPLLGARAGCRRSPAKVRVTSPSPFPPSSVVYIPHLVAFPPRSPPLCDSPGKVGFSSALSHPPLPFPSFMLTKNSLLFNRR